MKEFGNFSENGDEYVISKGKSLPRKWDNILWNDKFYCNVSHDGCVTSFYKHPGGLRTNLSNGSKRYFYIKNNEDGKYFDVPAVDATSSTIHGIGYTLFNYTKDGIETSLRITIPKEVNGEAWNLSIKNLAEIDTRLTVFCYAEFDLTGYFTPFGAKMVKSDYDEDLNRLIFLNNDPYCRHNYFNAFMASDTNITAFETIGENFLGTERNFKSPLALETGVCRNTINQGAGGDRRIDGDLAGVMQFDFVLKANESKDLQIILGVFEELCEVNDVTKEYLRPGGLDHALELYRTETDINFSKILINTPDIVLNRLFNTWAKYNLEFTAKWTRLYSRGFRDVLQDAMGVVSINKEAARENILDAMKHVYHNGRCRRAWDNVSNALSDEYYADGPVWIPLAINEYIKETGDMGILDEVCPYFDGGSGTVLEHMLSAVRSLYNDKGEHGLCLIRDGDWCDTAHLLGKNGKGEGVWLTIALYKALKEISELAGYLKNSSLKEEMEQMAQKLKESVNDSGWDGVWFLYAFNDKLQKVGSNENEEGKIFLNSQSWAVLSEITSSEREQMCLDVIDNQLDTCSGPLLLIPPYKKMDRGIGALTGFHPGTVENASCYCHAASFKIIADCKKGRGTKAYETLKKIIPGGEADSINPIADCPPYAFTNSRFAPFHPYLAGRSMVLWRTGTVSWCWQAVTEWILGIRRTFEGLTINPCIPSSWKGYSVKRIFRNTVYHIEVVNEEHVETGIREIYVDGELFCEKVLPFGKKDCYHVSVIMGKKGVRGHER